MSTEMCKIKRINNSIENIEYSEIFKHKTTLFDEDELIIPIRYCRTVDTSFKDISYLSKDLNSSWFLELASKTKQIICKCKSFTEINNANTICQHIQKLVECRLYEASFYPYCSNNSEELSSVKPEEDHNQQLENIEKAKITQITISKILSNKRFALFSKVLQLPNIQKDLCILNLNLMSVEQCIKILNFCCMCKKLESINLGYYEKDDANEELQKAISNLKGLFADCIIVNVHKIDAQNVHLEEESDTKDELINSIPEIEESLDPVHLSQPKNLQENN